MHIKAVVRASLIEYPGHVADAVYVGGCNWRCPFCHNVDLVLRPHELPDVDMAQVLAGWRERRDFIDGLVVSGGEPTLQAGLGELLAKIHDLGLLVKLDTNGYRPDVLQECLRRGLVDYVAMDVKSSPARYAEAVGLAVDVAQIESSIALLLHSEIDYEFRTTVVPGLVEMEDVRAIANLIAGARHYYLQAFRPAPTVGWGEVPPVDAPAPTLLRSMAEVAARWVQEVGLRGVSATH